MLFIALEGDVHVKRDRRELKNGQRPIGRIRISARVRFLLALLLMSSGMLVATLPGHAQWTGAITASATLTVDTAPYAVTVNPVTSIVYVVNLAATPSANDGTVTAINETTNLSTTIPVGSNPEAIAVNSITNMIYVANSDDDTVTVINGATNATATINVGANPTAIAVNSSTNMIYVTNSVGNSVAIINGASNAVAFVATGNNPEAVAVNQYTNTIYVTNGSSNNVTVINGATNTTTTVPTGTNPVAVAVDPITNITYVANYGVYNYDQASSSTITVISGVNYSTFSVPVSGNPTSVAVNSVSHQIYVLAANNGPVVTVINGKTNVATPVTVYGSYVAPLALAVNSATNETYVLGPQYLTVINSNNQAQPQIINVNPTNPNAVVADSNTGKIFSINRVPWLANGTVSVLTETYLAYNTAISAGNNVAQAAMDLNPTTQTLYVANASWDTNTSSYIGTVSIIPELSPSATPQTMYVGNYPTAVAVNPSTNMIYVADGDDNFVTVINGTLDTQVFETGTYPVALAINSQTNMIYVADEESQAVTVFNGATNTTSTIGVGYRPSALVVNPQTNMIYVANTGYTGTQSMTVINGATNATTTVNLGTATVEPKGYASIALNATTNMIYVANEIPGYVSVINGATNALVATVPAGSAPNAIAVNPLTGLVYVTDGIDGLLTVIDGASNTVQQTFSSFPGAQGLKVDTTNNKIYVTSANANPALAGTVTIIDGGEYTTGVLPLLNVTGITPTTALAFDPLTGNIFAAGNDASGTSTSVLAFQKPLALTMQEEALNPGATEQLTPAALVQPDVQRLPTGEPEWPAPIVPASSLYTHTVLLIHGRELDSDNNLDVVFGGLTFDQSGHWADGPPATGARKPFQFWNSQVVYVQWDSWYQYFTGTGVGGGWTVMDSVMNQYCREGISLNGTSDGCSVICHSAGCAALEAWISTNYFGDNGVYIDQVLAASSAADGSDVAPDQQTIPDNLFAAIWVQPAPIDPSLTPLYARLAVDHNNMQGTPVLGIAGTSQYFKDAYIDNPLQCLVWPYVGISDPLFDSWNGDCNHCYEPGLIIECHDTLVGLDSTCAINKTGAYLGCETNVTGFTEDASTFDSHGYWGSVNYPCGLGCPPYSSTGQDQYNPTYHTYRTDHSGGKATAVQEYSYCNLNTDAQECE
jgi:YVTN family beta-propeller protein